MLGAIIGDIVGSIYEFENNKSKTFDIYNPEMRMTDDSYLTIAVAKAIMKNYPIDYSPNTLNKFQKDLANEFVDIWFKHQSAGFGNMFSSWCIKSKTSNKIAPPYNSYGNGSAMRISPVGWVAKSEQEVKLLSKVVTEITHNHFEGLKGAEATSLAVFLARNNYSIDQIKERLIKDYYPEISNLNFNNLIKTYTFDSSCQNSVPQALFCFFISSSLEDTIRNCIAIGGDCDTTSAIAGSIAEAYYQKDKLSDFENKFLNQIIEQDVIKIIKEFHKIIGSNKFN